MLLLLLVAGFLALIAVTTSVFLLHCSRQGRANDESIDYRPSIDRHNERMNEPAMDGSITLQVFNDDGCASPAIFSLSATAAAAARNNY